MRFELLGPFKVTDEGRPAAIRGATPRAVLAYLLLHHDEVVATRTLLSAIWPQGVPATARKMVQNSISSVRTALSVTPRDDDRAMLLTHAPGYLLRVPEKNLDVARFRRLVESGRSARDEGADGTAVTALRDALELWRGPALTDLVEAGVAWPELAALEEQRLSVHEDLFDLELRRGRHQEVLSDLGELAASWPHRERLSGQLMTALYRCGRHVDALEVFRRLSARLRDELGLEPGTELRELERAILDHDDEVLLPEISAAAGPAVVEVARAHEPPPAAVDREPSPVPPVRSEAPQAQARPVDPEPGGHDAERRSERRSVVVVGALLAESGTTGSVEVTEDPEETAADGDELRTAFAEEVARTGGREIQGHGPMLLAVYGADRIRDDDPLRAVGAALGVRDRLGATGLAAQIVVESGEVLASFRTAGPSVSGRVLHRCLRAVSGAPAGEVVVNERVRDVTASAVGYAVTEDEEWYLALARVEDVPGRGSSPDAPLASAGTGSAGAGAVTPFVGRDRDLTLLEHLREMVATRRRAHLVTVLGEPGIGKTRLVEELLTRVADRDDGAGVLRLAATSFADLTGALAAAPDLSPPSALRMRRAPASVTTARDAVAELTARGTLVVACEDLQAGEPGALTALVDACAALPVLFVATARSELLDERPHWGSGLRSGTTLTLGPLPDDEVGALLTALTPADRRPVRPGDGLLARVGGNPRFAVEYACAASRRPAAVPAPGRTARSEPATPETVRRTLAALLDALPSEHRTIVGDASVLDGRFAAGDVAAVHPGGEEARVATLLADLEDRGVLRRERGGAPTAPGADPVYVFRLAGLREVAYQQLPRSVQGEKRRRAQGRRSREMTAGRPTG